jgi:GPH family glycoside/pentoside/hexuronide:cation symporter
MGLTPSFKHGYGSAAFALALVNTATLFFLARFLVDEALLPPALAGLVVIVARFWDALCDPLIGALSDRTRSAWGRRRPFLIVGALPLAVAFALLWQVPPGEPLQKALISGLMLILVSTAFTAVVVPYGALVPVLTPDDNERTSLIAHRMAWSMGGGIVAAVAFPLFRGHFGSYGSAALAIAPMVAPPILLAAWVTSGRDHADDSSADTGAPWSVLADPAFRRVVVLFLSCWVVIAALAALIPFYVAHLIGDPKAEDVILGVLQISALLTIPLITAATRRFNKWRTYSASVLAWGVVLLAFSAVPDGALTPAIVCAALAGPGVAAAHVLPWSMLPDVIDRDTRAYNRDRSGAYAGMMTFLEQLASAVAVSAMLFGLQLAGYVEGADHQPEAARMAIRVAMGPVPAVVLIVAALLAWRWSRDPGHDTRVSIPSVP